MFAMAAILIGVVGVGLRPPPQHAQEAGGLGAGPAVRY